MSRSIKRLQAGSAAIQYFRCDCGCSGATSTTSVVAAATGFWSPLTNPEALPAVGGVFTPTPESFDLIYDPANGDVFNVWVDL